MPPIVNAVHTKEPTQSDDRIRIRIEDSFVKPLLPAYMERRRNDVEQIVEALANGDFELIRLRGHNMFGSGGAYGLERISEIGADIEKAAKKRDPEQVMKDVETLRDFLRRLEIIT